MTPARYILAEAKILASLSWETKIANTFHNYLNACEMRQRSGERMRLLRRRKHRGALRERARGRSEVAAALREALGEAAEPLGRAPC